MLARFVKLPIGMQLPTNILVPIDFSDYSTSALEYAVALAARLDAKVHVVNVIPVLALGVPEMGMAFSAAMVDKLVAENQGALERLVDPHRKTVPIASVMIRSGDPRDMIPATAGEVGADLIVMGTHGRRGISRALLGSVTESVVRTASVPVLTVHRGPTK